MKTIMRHDKKLLIDSNFIHVVEKRTPGLIYVLGTTSCAMYVHLGGHSYNCNTFKAKNSAYCALWKEL